MPTHNAVDERRRAAGLEDDQGLCRESSRIIIRSTRRPYLADAASQSAKASLPTPSLAKVDWKRRSAAGS